MFVSRPERAKFKWVFQNAPLPYICFNWIECKWLPLLKKNQCRAARMAALSTSQLVTLFLEKINSIILDQVVQPAILVVFLNNEHLRY